MKAQVIDNKIVAIGETVVKTDDNNVYDIDIDMLPLTEDGEIDYEKIFISSFKIEDDKIIILNEES